MRTHLNQIKCNVETESLCKSVIFGNISLTIVCNQKANNVLADLLTLKGSVQLNAAFSKSAWLLSTILSWVGVTKFPFTYFFTDDIFYFVDATILSIQSHSYLTNVIIAKLWWHLSDMNV